MPSLLSFFGSGAVFRPLLFFFFRGGFGFRRRLRSRRVFFRGNFAGCRFSGNFRRTFFGCNITFSARAFRGDFPLGGARLVMTLPLPRPVDA